jgi:hypothetical protein
LFYTISFVLKNHCTQEKETIENLEAQVLGSKRRCGKKDISYKGLLCASSDFGGTVALTINPTTKNFDSHQLDCLGISMVPVEHQKKLREQINKEYRKVFTTNLSFY